MSHDQGLIDPPPELALRSAQRKSRDDGRGPFALWPSNQGHELALGIGVAIDVPLGCLNRPVTGKQLHIAQRATRLMDQPRCSRDKRSPPGMRRTAHKADSSI